MSADDTAPQWRREGYWSDLADEGDRESEQTNARFYGMKGEEYAQVRWDLILYETGHSDALIPERGYEGHLPGPLTKVQIKGARLKVKAGDGGRAGLFRLWENDHEILVDEDAKYLFLGYDPSRPDPVRCVRWMDAADLSDVAPGDDVTWYDAEHSTKDGRPTSLNVKRVFPDL